MMKSLFLSPPSFGGFDGGAGSRYQCKREVKSFWYPTWLAQLAALVEGSRLIDCPALGLEVDDVLPLADEYELLVLYTSTPTFRNDVRIAEAFKARNPSLMIGLCGAHVAISPEQSLTASEAIDFVAGNEFDFTIKEIAEGSPLARVAGISYRDNGTVVHNPEREILQDMDRLPWVSPVYGRDLVLEDYYNGYMLHPYLSFYTGRGCKSRCTFCLWPQTIGGHKYRVRSIEHVVGEVEYVQQHCPQIKEIFFDDDTLTDNAPHIEALSRLISPMLAERRLTWSCNAKGNVPYETLRVLKENRLRLLTVGFESGVQAILNNVRKGMKITRYRRFAEDCHKLGVKIHGAFILGLPG